ncbi:translocation protein in type III secretion system, RhcU [Aliidongia dinghuensis]|uniref:Translocation protein in type III secretion system, RhcU n=1 Tax=Aliidongia dinghuensis TaxID=1867774 RepID=A0A8J2YQ33_9PROT|nr:EscU/YscU/HrcU family type III secretion system export apparatus switch protein [Aliidongia dinghuensis]GGF05310.1 translocation protein in type III secretion system, RhcU [Aliidongia dinghuensis]
MSDQQPTEEKSLPASPRKLREARRKGRVSGSQDFVTGLAVAAATLFLVLRWPHMLAAWQHAVDVTADATTVPFAAAETMVNPALASLATATALPLVAVIVAAVMLANMIVKSGIPLSAESIKPKLERVHPMNGLKLIFSLKSLFEFLKSIVKASLLLVVLGAAILYGLGPLMAAPACGVLCLGAAAAAAFLPLLIGGVLLFLVAGFPDIALQRWLFLRQMRMTRSELKHERKEEEGNPLFRRARRERHRESLAGARLDITRSTVVLLAPGELAAGLRFVANETPAPVLIARAAGAALATELARARDAGIMILEDPDLARRVAGRTPLGSFIPKSLFNEVAALLVRHGLA